MNPRSYPGDKRKCRARAQRSVIKTSDIRDWQKKKKLYSTATKYRFKNAKFGWKYSPS